MQEITPESIAALLQTLEARRKQTISVRQIEKEAGLYQASLSKIANGTAPLKSSVKAKLQVVLEKYNLI